MKKLIISAVLLMFLIGTVSAQQYKVDFGEEDNSLSEWSGSTSYININSIDTAEDASQYSMNFEMGGGDGTQVVSKPTDPIYTETTNISFWMKERSNDFLGHDIRFKDSSGNRIFALNGGGGSYILNQAGLSTDSWYLITSDIDWVNEDVTWYANGTTIQTNAFINSPAEITELEINMNDNLDNQGATYDSLPVSSFTLNSPPDNATRGFSTVDFNHTVTPQTEGADVIGVRLWYPNGTLYGDFEESVDVSVGESYTQIKSINLNATDLPEGDMKWQGQYSNLTTGGFYTSENRTLTVNADAANITFSNLDPADGSIFDVNESVNFNALIEAPEGNSMDDAKIDWYGLSGQGTGSITPLSSYTNSVTVSGSEEFTETGSYEWYATAQPEGGSYQDSVTRSFEIEAAAPDLAFNSPDDGDTFSYPYTSDNTDVDVSWGVSSYSESGTTALYRNGSEITNRSFSSYSSTTFTETETLSNGTYEYYATAETADNSVTSNTVTITVTEEDATPPSIDVQSPVEGENFTYDPDETSALVPFEWGVESGGETGTTRVILNGSEIYSDSFASLSSTAFDHDEALENGTYEFYITAETSSYTIESNVTTFNVEQSETYYSSDSFGDNIGEAFAGFLSSFFGGFLNSVEDSVSDSNQTLIAAVIAIIFAIVAAWLSGSSIIGVGTLLLVVLGFTVRGWMPSWVGFVFITLTALGLALTAGKVAGGG